MASRINTLVMTAGLAVLALGASAVPVSAATSPTTSQTSTMTSTAASTAMSGAANGSGTSTFGIQPSYGSNKDTRTAFTYSATAGAAAKDSALVDNFSDKPLTLQIYASDAFNTPEGGYDLLPAAKAPKDVGTWVKFDTTKPFVTIPPKSQLKVPFTFSIPLNATPGDHAGGIVVSLTTPSIDSHGNKVNVEQRVGTRIYSRVAGTLKAEFQIEKVSAVYHSAWNPFGSGSVSVSYTVRNTGNVRLGGKQATRVTSLFGGSVKADALKDIEELLPGQAVVLSTTAHHVLPSFTSTARVSVDPVAVPGDPDPKLTGATRTATMATVPWSALILLALIGGLGFWELRRRRRSRAPLAPEAPRPASADTAARESVA